MSHVPNEQFNQCTGFIRIVGITAVGVYYTTIVLMNYEFYTKQNDIRKTPNVTMELITDVKRYHF